MDLTPVGSTQDPELRLTRVDAGIQQITALLKELSSESTANDIRVDDNCVEFSLITSEDSKRYRIIVTEDYPEGTLVFGEDSAVLDVNQPLDKFLRNLVANGGSAVVRNRSLSQESVSSCSNHSIYDDDDLELEAEDEEHHHETCSELLKDIASIRLRYSDRAMSIKEFHGLEDIDVDLHFDTSFLSVHVARAWCIDNKKPITIRLTLNKMEYMDYQTVPKVKVFQEERSTSRIATLIILRKLVENYLESLWGPISNKVLAELRDSEQTNPGTSVDGAFTIRLADQGEDDEHAVGESVENLSHGFLVVLYHYIRCRLPTLNEHCIICTNKIAASTDLLKPSVCSNDLCFFAHRELGLMADLGMQLNISFHVFNILLVTALAAASSSRREVIFNPFPTIFHPDHPDRPVLSSNSKTPDSWTLVEQIVKSFPSTSELVRHTSHNVIKRVLNHARAHVLCYSFLEWVVNSNRCHIAFLPRKKHLSFIKTPFQYLMVSQSPTMEAKFQEHKRRFGTVFAFHGSQFENWHSILRRGLMVASGTTLEVNGASYGTGIYFSPNGKKSFNYSNPHAIEREKECARGLFDQYSRLSCIALCEIVNDSDHVKKHSASVWTCSNETYVCTRFLFVYQHAGSHDDDKMVEDINLTDASVLKELQFRLSMYSSL